VPIETPIARIGEAADTSVLAPPEVGQESADGPKPTPVASRLLAEHGLKPTDVSASSTRRVTKRAVLEYLNGPQSPVDAPVSDGAVVPLSRMRAAIAEHMLRAKLTIPHGQSVMDADVTGLVAWRDQHKDAFAKQAGAGLTFTVLFVSALARALAQRGHAEVHLGFAVALDQGLIVPVVRSADHLNLAETARAVADLAHRARTGALKPDETQGALMTVSNVGSFGNLSASPIIPLNQIGILGPGLVEKRPLAAPDGGLKLGYRCLMSLMFDRRAMDDLAADRLLRLTIELLLQLAEDAHGGQDVRHA
jgi:2-oxoglutarate dehydrogenase E2 component (dihydrolipoamide succinyltransferase)